MPDMEPDPVIADHAGQRNMEVLFDADNWIDCLGNLAGGLRINFPPPAEQIEEEVAVVMPNLASPRHPDAESEGFGA